jgi:prepilin-type N-terminal cleavage/methylation domain-containing protein
MKHASQRLGPLPTRAFTLVEIMVVVVIIGLLAALAIPAFQRNQRATQNARVINDYRVFVQAFEIFNTQNGAWPPNAGSGIVPTGMSGNFKEDTWKEAKTPIGGRWNWDLDKSDFKAGVTIAGYTITDEQAAEIDAKIDDGDLSTGTFRKTAGGTNRLTYILVE